MVGRTSLILFESLALFCFVLLKKDGKLRFFDGRDDYMTAAAIIRFYLKKLKIFLFLFLFRDNSESPWYWVFVTSVKNHWSKVILHGSGPSFIFKLVFPPFQNRFFSFPTAPQTWVVRRIKYYIYSALFKIIIVFLWPFTQTKTANIRLILRCFWLWKIHCNIYNSFQKRGKPFLPL